MNSIDSALTIVLSKIFLKGMINVLELRRLNRITWGRFACLQTIKWILMTYTTINIVYSVTVWYPCLFPRPVTRTIMDGWLIVSFPFIIRNHVTVLLMGNDLQLIKAIGEWLCP